MHICAYINISMYTNIYTFICYTYMCMYKYKYVYKYIIPDIYNQYNLT